MTSNSPKLTNLSLFSFAAASILFGLADWSASNRADLSSFPMPKPGVSVKANGHTSASGNYALWVDVASEIDPADTGPRSDLGCSIEAMLITKQRPALLVRSTSLHHAADYYWGRTISYSTPVFQMPKGEYSLRVANRGCAPGQFQGGMMSLNQYYPVTIPTSFLLRVLAYVFAAVGMLGLMLTFIRRARSISLPM
jgi:hypothetical protein